MKAVSLTGLPGTLSHIFYRVITHQAFMEDRLVARRVLGAAWSDEQETEFLSSRNLDQIWSSEAVHPILSVSPEPQE